ncbi:MAG: TIGR03435 family protein [Terracidiphilus sp.]
MMKQIELRSLVAFIAAGVALSASISTAQQPQEAKPLQFEVAAIKPSTPRLEFDSWTGVTGGLYRMVNVPLKQWVKLGLSVRDYALMAPPWLDTSRFDLVAKLPAGKPAGQEPLPEMMKALLIERFGLKWHEELRTVPGYELVTDKKVLLKPASLLERMQGQGMSSGPTLIGGTNMSMSEFSGALGEALGRPVVDATHLTGGYDIKLMWRPVDDAEAAREKQYGVDVDNLPSSISTAVREQLGLRLQNAKVQSRVTVVDNINRQPTAN